MVDVDIAEADQNAAEEVVAVSSGEQALALEALGQLLRAQAGRFAQNLAEQPARRSFAVAAVGTLDLGIVYQPTLLTNQIRAGKGCGPCSGCAVPRGYPAVIDSICQCWQRSNRSIADLVAHRGLIRDTYLAQA